MKISRSCESKNAYFYNIYSLFINIVCYIWEVEMCVCIHVFACVHLCDVIANFLINSLYHGKDWQNSGLQDCRQAVGLSVLFFILHMEVLMSCPLSNFVNKIQYILESQPLLMELGRCFRNVYSAWGRKPLFGSPADEVSLPCEVPSWWNFGKMRWNERCD